MKWFLVLLFFAALSFVPSRQDPRFSLLARGIIPPISFVDSVFVGWVSRYNSPGNGYDDPTTVVTDAEGNVYVAGLGGGDFATVKYNASGQQQWTARYSTPGSSGDWVNGLAVDDLGNVYVTGYGSSLDGISSDFVTIKYNASGAEQWIARYNGPGDYYDEANTIVVDGEGNAYITGYSFGSGTVGDFATIKYNSSGQELWVARYNGTGNGYDEALDLAMDTLGNVYVTGYSPGLGTAIDFATVKYDTSGIQQWARRYDGPGSELDYAYDIAVSKSGDVYVTGSSSGDYATIKYDAVGQEQWTARFDGGYSDFSAALALDDSGNVVVTGYSSDLITAEDYATVKYDTFGKEQWVARYDGPESSADHASAIAIDDSGNVYVTGHSAAVGTGNDFATIRYDGSGQEVWVARYDADSSDDRGTAIVLDASGVYVTGLSLNTATNYDFATIKYQETPTAVGSDGEEVPATHSLSQNYPNPFNPETQIRFEIPSYGFVTLAIYDLLGREVAVLVRERLSPGMYARTWNASGLPSGVYYYRLSAESYVETRKMLLLK